MKKKGFNGKNLLAFLLAVTLAVTSVPMTKVSAQEGELPENVTTETEITDTEKAENTAEETKDAEEASLQYLVIENPSVTTPGTQNIVAGIGSDTQRVSKAVLSYRNNTTGATYKAEASKSVEGAVLFAVDFTDDSQSGEYQLTSLEYTLGEQDYKVSMSSMKMDTRFGVNQTVETQPDGYLTTETTGVQARSNLVGAAGGTSASGTQVSQDIVTFDGDGNATSVNTLSQAISKAGGNLVGAKKKNIVVVLDPGHGGSDGGAQGNGLSEKNLNLSIAKYCKSELEQYSGVKVYMTRTNDTFVSLGDRATLAKNWGADVFVSIHINSGSAAANGAEVWYPNPTGNANIHKKGAELAQSIEDQLAALGLKKRGIHYRNYSYDRSVDQNVGDIDYYSVIRNNKANGIPAVIVEHAFVSNPTDASKYLGSSKALKKLGVADATGIAKALGLSKEPDYEAKDTQVSATLNKKQTKVTLKATGLEKAGGVKFQVYSKENGKDDVKWYTAKYADGVWTASANIKDHKSSGKYYVNLYVVRSIGGQYKVSKATFQVDAPEVSEVKVTNVKQADGTFQVDAAVSAKAGVKNVKVAVWRKSNQKDLKWYSATSKGDGSYGATVDNKDFKDAYGKYNYSVSVETKSGLTVNTEAQSYKLKAPKMVWKVKDKSSHTKKRVTIVKMPYQKNAQKVTLQVWSKELGKKYKKTYTAKKKSNGTWEADVKIKDFKAAGKYTVTAYATLQNGTTKKLGSTTFKVTAPSVKSVQIKSLNNIKGTFKVAETIQSSAPVTKVEMEVWCAGKKKDLYTYTAKKGLNGKYTATVNIKNHKYNYGKYKVYTYVTDKAGVRVRVDKRNVNLTKPQTTITLSASQNNSREKAVVNNVPYGSRVKKVKYKVWSVANGQDDVKWYTAKKNTTGKYTYTIPLVNHLDTGKIKIEVYAYYKDGAREKLLKKKFSIPLYSIAGTTSTNAAQMARYYKANATYPAAYANSDAPNIETFAQIYIEECNAEGIRAEVAFAQAMKETGFLRFSGRVPVTAYNFAGMGAIDSDNTAYATYGSVREGIRAQVQHLKAYANSEPLNQSLADGRFGLVTRGTAPYVEWLGISENPYGKGWATAYRYGYSLRDDYIAKMMRY